MSHHQPGEVTKKEYRKNIFICATVKLLTIVNTHLIMTRIMLFAPKHIAMAQVVMLKQCFDEFESWKENLIAIGCFCATQPAVSICLIEYYYVGK